MKRNENYLEAAFKMYLAGTSKEDVLNYLEEQIELNKVLPVKVWKEDEETKLPIYSKPGDACMDVYAKSIDYDDSNDRYIVHTGLHFALPMGYEMELRPRSSNTKYEVYIPNTPGTLDEGYRGELMMIFKLRTSKAIVNCIGNLGEALNTIIKNNNIDGYNSLTDAHSIYKDIEEVNKFPYNVGDRICQLLIRKRELIVWDEVNNLEDLGETERGNGGFGHTGK